MNSSLLEVRPAVKEALAQSRAVVALESTLIAHGLPYPRNLEVAREAESLVRQLGAVPATIAVLRGQAIIGLNGAELEHLATSPDVRKAATRDLGLAIAQRADAATTVSATMRLAHLAGIQVFATGGIGGVHPGDGHDVSADLEELARTPVAVVCAGAKSILDLRATLERLETLGVPVLGWRTDRFPAFYLQSSGLGVSGVVRDGDEVCNILRAHWTISSSGVVIARSVSSEFALSDEEFALALAQAEHQATIQHIHGAQLTPFLLAQLHQATQGRTLRANQSLILANVELATEIALTLAKG
jgi:pseudouridine-5'-phosphate glycosidase